jgi:glycine cleavage system transcriptional repressor
VPLLAVTVIGPDRPGIITAVTGVLAELGGNLEDSTMTILRGHFAMMLLAACATSPADVQAALARVADRFGLVVSVREVPEEPEPAVEGQHVVLRVHGADRPGIVSAMTRVIADVGGNITDLTTRLSGGLYLLVAEADLPVRVDLVEVQKRLSARAGDLGVDAAVHPADEDVL